MYKSIGYIQYINIYLFIDSFPNLSHVFRIHYFVPRCPVLDVSPRRSTTLHSAPAVGVGIGKAKLLRPASNISLSFSNHEKYIFQTLQTYSKTASYHFWCICLIVFGYLCAWAWWIASELRVSKDGFPAANPAATPTNATTIYCYSSSYYPHTHQRTCVHLFLVMAFNF